MQLLIATNNAGKVIEVDRALDGLGIELRQPRDVGITIEMPEETGATFKDNALIKARHFYEHARLPTIGEDSGIFVEALAGELGVKTRRWGAGPEASDSEWITFFLKRMKGEPNRRASFHSVVAYIDSEGKEYTFDGRCDGVITDALQAKFLPGLPFDACFRPEGYHCVYGALTLEQKNSTSHRGRALQQFRSFLERNL